MTIRYAYQVEIKVKNSWEVQSEWSSKIRANLVAIGEKARVRTVTYTRQ